MKPFCWAGYFEKSYFKKVLLLFFHHFNFRLNRGGKRKNSPFNSSHCLALAQTKIELGSGCGSVGRAVDSDSKGPWFESSHQQKFILKIYCQLYWKDENKEKEAGNGPFLKKLRLRNSKLGSNISAIVMLLSCSLVVVLFAPLTAALLWLIFLWKWCSMMHIVKFLIS